MATGRRARHAQHAPWRTRLRVPPTALAVGGLAALFIVAGTLALHVLTVPSDLRQERVAGPAAAPGHSIAASRVRASDTRAARSEDRRTPSPTPPPTTAAATVSPTPSPAPATSSARPSPRPSPSSTSGNPLPLPTLTRPAHG